MLKSPTLMSMGEKVAYWFLFSIIVVLVKHFYISIGYLKLACACWSWFYCAPQVGRWRRPWGRPDGPSDEPQGRLWGRPDGDLMMGRAQAPDPGPQGMYVLNNWGAHTFWLEIYFKNYSSTWSAIQNVLKWHFNMIYHPKCLKMAAQHLKCFTWGAVDTQFNKP